MEKILTVYSMSIKQISQYEKTQNFAVQNTVVISNCLVRTNFTENL
jgi:hypothetical protein